MTMEAQDVLNVLSILDDAGLTATLDGGWGVEALLGAQYRDHTDVDLIIDLRDVRPAVEALGGAGFEIVEHEGIEEIRLADGDDHVIDLRGYATDERGNRWAASRLPSDGPPDIASESITYGWVGGRQVSCLSPEHLAASARSRELSEGEMGDIVRLGERFHTPVPADLRRY